MVGAVVVLWGPGVGEGRGGTFDVDGVTARVRRQYREWRRQLCGEPLTAWQVDAIAELVHGYLGSRNG